MKQLEIRICSRLPAMIESKLPLRVGYETPLEKEKRLLGEVLYAAMTRARGECILIIPSAGLSPQQLRDIRMQIGYIAGTCEWEHMTDKKSGLFNVRELQVIPYICKGYSAKEIESATKIPFHTVRDHIKSIYAKSDCHNKAEFISFMQSNPV